MTTKRLLQLSLFLCFAAGARADAPGVFAIAGGTVHPVSGPEIANGTVLIRDGLIEAVGANVAIPADAVTIDAKGMHVYPGLFDAQTSLGFPKPVSRTPGRRGGGAAERPTPAAAPPEPTAASLAARNAAPTDDDLDAKRATGVTTVVVAPRTGIFNGQSAVLNLAGGSNDARLLKSPAAVQVSYAPRPAWTFPDSLMGVIADIRQSLIDAQQHAAAKTIYAKSPGGLQRPEESDVLDALAPVVRGELPMVFIADTELAIRRSIAIASEMKIKPIFSGARQGYRMADDLKAFGAPVLVSVKWPTPPADRDEREEQPLRVIRDRQLAPTTPAVLAKSGVTFALVSGPSGAPADFLSGIRKAIENGLDPNDALRAVTLSPARIFGVARQLGSLERGKIANVVISDKPIFEKKAKVRHVFVDGRETRLPEPDKGKGSATGTSTADGAADTAAPPLSAIALPSSPAPAPTLPGPVTVIRNATLLTITHGRIEHGSVLIRGTKIAAVGPDAQIGVPDGAQVIDAAGKLVMPGIIDTHSHTNVEGSVNEISLPNTGMVRIRDVLTNEDVAAYRELAGGTTTAHVLHGSANAIGGQNQVVKWKWGRPVSEWIVEDAHHSIKFALGENPKSSNFQPPPGQPLQYPKSRMGVEEVIRGAFVQARDYTARWEEYEAKQKRGEAAIPPRRDLLMEEMVDILAGRVWVHSHCYRADEILMLLRVSDEMGFHVRTLQHVLEGYKVSKEIAAHDVGAGTFSDWWGYKAEAADAIPYNVAMMTHAGVLVSVNSDSDELARRLNLEAAKTMKYGGLTEEEALKTCTLNGAKELGLDARIGSLDVGKDADVVIWTGHPFSTYSRAETTFIEGTVYFDRAKDLAERPLLAREKKDRIQHERDEDTKLKKEEPKKDDDESRPEPTAGVEGDDHA